MGPETNPNKTNELIGSLLLIALVGGIFVIGVTYAIKFLVLSNEPEVREVPLRAPKCEWSFAEYEKLVQEGQSLVVLTDTKSYAVAGELLSKKKVVRRSGEIACGYLYARASRGNKPLDELYDSIYISPQEFGGHLIRPRSITVDKKQENKTEVLFPLSAVPYLPTVPYDPQAQNFEITDWTKLFNAASKIKIDIGLSTLSASGLIEEVRISYRCWNPDTGEEVHDCQLSLEE